MAFNCGAFLLTHPRMYLLQSLPVSMVFLRVSGVKFEGFAIEWR